MAILVVLLRARMIIAAIIFVVIILGTVAAVRVSKYKGDRFLQFAGPVLTPVGKDSTQEKIVRRARLLSARINTADYKYCSAAFSSLNRFCEFIRTSMPADSENT